MSNRKIDVIEGAVINVLNIRNLTAEQIEETLNTLKLTRSACITAHPYTIADALIDAVVAAKASEQAPKYYLSKYFRITSTNYECYKDKLDANKAFRKLTN